MYVSNAQPVMTLAVRSLELWVDAHGVLLELRLALRAQSGLKLGVRLGQGVMLTR